MQRDINAGYALIVVMLFLPILSLLFFSITANGIMEFKMSVAYANKVQAFYLAEKRLLQLEKQVRSSDCVNIAGCKSLSHKKCGVDTYLLQASAEYHGVMSTLYSVVVKVTDNNSCLPEEKWTSGRKSFWMAE